MPPALLRLRPPFASTVPGCLSTLRWGPRRGPLRWTSARSPLALARQRPCAMHGVQLAMAGNRTVRAVPDPAARCRFCARRSVRPFDCKRAPRECTQATTCRVARGTASTHRAFQRSVRCLHRSRWRRSGRSRSTLFWRRSRAASASARSRRSARPEPARSIMWCQLCSAEPVWRRWCGKRQWRMQWKSMNLQKRCASLPPSRPLSLTPLDPSNFFTALETV